MLVELVVENFYSFRDEETFSMMGTHIAEHPGTVEETNIFPINKVSTLYGANASGKSNLLRAMALIREGLFVKPGQEARWFNKIKPFHLDAASEQKETLLETSFMIAGHLYRYGFFVNREEITEEYLFMEKNGEEQQVIFHRNHNEIEGVWCADAIKPKRLIMADCIGNHPEMARWFQDMRILMRSLDASLSISMAKLHLKKYKHNLLTLIQVADPSIRDIEIRDVAQDDGHHQDEFFVIKEKKRLDGTFERFSEGFLFQDVESAGTVKLLALAGPIIEALENGSLLMIDEMDQSFHTLMTRYVLELFRGDFNTKGAQLVFSTHDISNLRSELFRRDQVWFVEKRHEGNSALVSLVAFKFDESERKNSFAFYQNYLNGKYGAVPFLPPADWWVENGEEA